MSLEIHIDSEAALDDFALALVELSPSRAVICLTGTLGAGKTRLVRGVAAATGVDPKHVVSPTFVLCQTYQGRRTIHHLDAYRLGDDDEFLELGAEEMMESDALTFIEWGERIARCLPDDRLNITMEIMAGEGSANSAAESDAGEDPATTARRLRLSSSGPVCQQWLVQLAQRLGQLGQLGQSPGKRGKR